MTAYSQIELIATDWSQIMADTFPTPVAAYFAATTPAEIADCFTADGVAVDDGRTHRGKNAILRWREEVSTISFRQDFLTSRQDGDRLIVSCRVSGDFKGSPVELDYAFRLNDGRIAHLEIS
jgi:hypothetical protein